MDHIDDTDRTDRTDQAGGSGGRPPRPRVSWWSRPAQPAPAPREKPARPPEPSTSAPSTESAAPAGGVPASAPSTAGPYAPDTATAPVSAAVAPHEPDPYGTPSYVTPPYGTPPYDQTPCDTPPYDTTPHDTPPHGGPGPEAPAPPVQRPPTVSPAAAEQAAPGQEAVPAAAVAAAPGHVLPAWDGGGAPGGAWHRYDPWSAPDAGPALPEDGAARSGRPRRRRGYPAALAFGLVTAVLGGAVGAYLEHRHAAAPTALPQEAAGDAGRAPGSVAGIAASTLPGVVTLHVSGADEADTGTGFVLDRQGHILTNNHVVAPAGSSGEISVTFSSGRTADAKLVGKDGGYDLAVVQVNGIAGLKPLPLGNSDNVRVGDPVVAIGAPFDLSNTVTSGIISAKDRPITAGESDDSEGGDVSYVDALQTDAPINPGNSGGPLVDANARVIGINSAIRAADSGTEPDGGGQAGSIGLGFAIPVNQARRVARELIDTGRATHPVIGVTLDPDYRGDGARVAAKAADGGPAVEADGPAARAGIRTGDVVTAVDGVAVRSDEELIVKIRAHRPGDRLTLTVRRAGTDRTIRLTLGSATGM